MATIAPAKPSTSTERDWMKPQAMAIPKEGYFELEKGRYGPVFPQTPACYGFSVVAKVKPGRDKTIREYGKNIEDAVNADPSVLAPNASKQTSCRAQLLRL
jgi:hypothetical protein